MDDIIEQIINPKITTPTKISINLFIPLNTLLLVGATTIIHPFINFS